jgi:hypothetical protein
MRHPLTEVPPGSGQLIGMVSVAAGVRLAWSDAFQGPARGFAPASIWPSRSRSTRWFLDRRRPGVRRNLLAGTVPGPIIDLLDRALLIVMLVELPYTLRVSFRRHTLASEPLLSRG